MGVWLDSTGSGAENHMKQAQSHYYCFFFFNTFSFWVYLDHSKQWKKWNQNSFVSYSLKLQQEANVT